MPGDLADGMELRVARTDPRPRGPPRGRGRPVRGRAAGRHDLRRPGRRRGQGRATGRGPPASRRRPLRRLEPGQADGRARPARPRRAATRSDACWTRPTSCSRTCDPARSSACSAPPPASRRPRLVTCSISAWGSERPGPRRTGLGAAGPRPGRHPAGALHRRRPHLDALPRRQRRRRAPGRHRHGRRPGQARVDRLRPARRDLAARRAALPQRGADLPPRGPAAQGDAPDATRSSCGSTTRPTAAP